jgi:hypothetical protein
LNRNNEQTNMKTTTKPYFDAEGLFNVVQNSQTSFNRIRALAIEQFPQAMRDEAILELVRRHLEILNEVQP